MSVDDKAAKLIVKQQEKVMYFWIFISAITIGSYIVLWPDLDPFYSLLYGIPVLFMTSQTSEWSEGFWQGFHSENQLRTSAEGIISRRSGEEVYASNLGMIRDQQKFSFKMLAVLVGVLVIVSNVETISKFSFIVWLFIIIPVFYIGQFIGKEAGLKKGFHIRITGFSESILSASETHLAWAKELGDKAKVAISEKNYANALEHLQQQKDHYLRASSKERSSKIESTILDSSVSKDLANVFRLEKKHLGALIHIIYWVANSQSITKDQESKLRAYFNRTKLKGATVEDVMEYCLADGVKELRAIEVDVNSWK